jgi:hypothetical protein
MVGARGATSEEAIVRRLMQLFWDEPAVALGVIAAAAVAIVKVASGGGLNADDVLAILAPLGAAAGVRPLVTPTRARPAAGHSVQPEPVS